jgi:hypothetical protein
LCEELEEQKQSEWYGSSAECLKILNGVAARHEINTSSKSWPNAANWLTRSLNKIRSNLLEGLKIEITLRRLTKDENYKKNTTTIKVRKMPSLTFLNPPDQF